MPSSSRRKPKVWAPESKNQENHAHFNHGLWYCCCLPVVDGAGCLPSNLHHWTRVLLHSVTDFTTSLSGSKLSGICSTKSLLSGSILWEAKSPPGQWKTPLSLKIKTQTYFSQRKNQFLSVRELFFLCGSSLLVHECKSCSCILVAASQKWSVSFSPNCTFGLTSWATGWVATFFLNIFPPLSSVNGSKTPAFPVFEPHNLGHFLWFFHKLIVWLSWSPALKIHISFFLPYIWNSSITSSPEVIFGLVVASVCEICPK